ncbi:hypothetical protein [uncultured Erythrobacter sp.]|uniref:hypothetical protein n=1 Tax=uncultured Erythrobacter sp. TaxID=263913 RepID=UPI002637375B|nr:hypothetical protein [uncultured Erythrobacter sp.]
MQNNDEARTTPIGLFHYAHSYAASALELERSEVDATHPDAPIRYLFSHAIELYLKSFLLMKGVSLSELRSRNLGHDLPALLKRASEFQFHVSEEMEAQIGLANDAIMDRYIETGYRQVLSPESMTAICQHLNDEIGALVYADFGTKRAVPALK